MKLIHFHHFLQIEPMTASEYKQGTQILYVQYTFAESPFGMLLLASTEKGICYMAFIEQQERALSALFAYFPTAQFQEQLNDKHRAALAFFRQQDQPLPEIKLHLKGTDFQLKVWQHLLHIPFGKLITYRDLALAIGKPGASRAVGTAIGRNPVAFLVPCHRVVQASGALGGYRWGTDRKATLIDWEAAKVGLSHPVVKNNR